MDKVNRRNKASCFWRDSSTDSDFENTPNFGSHNDSIENLCLRGFEKEPRVLVKKMNIEPYIRKKKWKSKKLRQKPLQHVSSCYVKLMKEDLELLQKEVQENSRLNKLKTKGILSIPVPPCKICERACDDERTLRSHMEKTHLLVYKSEQGRKSQKRVSFSDHIIVHELREYHRCKKCTKIFERYKTLKAHMKLEHRKRKCYICNYCTKKFVDRMFFKVHIKHHCDVCGILMPNKRKLFAHKRESCRVPKKYACKTCQNTFFSYMGLKEHSYDHLEDLFVCDMCQAQYTSKCALAIHIKFLHSAKPPKELYSNRSLGTEKLYLCNFCDISTLDRNVIEQHVSMLPDEGRPLSYTDFICDQCLRKFDTETDMLAHKWSHYLTTRSQPDDFVTKRIYNIREKLPTLMQPRIVLERLKDVKPSSGLDGNRNIKSGEKSENFENGIVKKTDDLQRKSDGAKPNNGLIPNPEEEIQVMDMSEKNSTDTAENFAQNEVSVVLKNAIIDQRSKKTLISKYQCEKCHKYYSSNYNLNRHKLRVHENFENLQCRNCKETFVWPSMLKSHRCFQRTNSHKDYSRSEMHFDNYRDFGAANIDELLDISEDEDYMNSVDFDIPAPIVELTEYDQIDASDDTCANQNKDFGMPSLNAYKIVMQEVPIEF